MTQTKLVVKPDCLFGKRGKHDLVGLKLDCTEAQQFIAARMNKVRAGWPGCWAAGG
jgi:ATP citrate (pro-S)-lyase